MYYGLHSIPFWEWLTYYFLQQYLGWSENLEGKVGEVSVTKPRPESPAGLLGHLPGSWHGIKPQSQEPCILWYVALT